MNDYKIIKKVFNLAHYDFTNNFTKWLSIAGLHAIMISIFFCAFCCVTSDYDVTFWGWPPNILFDWTNKFYGLIVENISYLKVGVTSFVFLGCLILLPLVILQNCLDLAFDSSMRGFSIGGIRVSYFVVMILTNGLTLLFLQIMSCLIIFAILYCMQTSFVLNIFIIRFFMLIVGCLVLYCMQISYFLRMHILEYKKGIWQSSKEVGQMITGKLLFLCKILLFQVLMGSSIFVFLYLFFGVFIKILMPIVLWFFNVCSLPIEPLFILMMYNFFYVWAYILLYAWICLIIAHVYRQLICPPVDTISCPSCQSCEK